MTLALADWESLATGVAVVGTDATVRRVEIGGSVGFWDVSVMKDVCDGGLESELLEVGVWINRLIGGTDVVRGLVTGAKDEEVAESLRVLGSRMLLPAGRVTGILEGSGGGGGPPTDMAESSQALIQPW